MTTRRPGRSIGSALLSVLLATAFLAPAVLAAESAQAKVPVETFELSNGMRFLLVQKPEMATVAGGWVAHVGSSNEQIGQTGLAHFFEHMMFKGSRTIGTTNIERDLQILAEQEALQDEIRAHYAKQRERWRRGEIADPFAADARTPELIDLEARFQKLVDEQRALMVKDEFDQVYTQAGGTRMNAFTNQDMTVYFITVPANKLELWFWMESDRLKENVRREFYSERDVVFEERRLRTESTPTGPFEEQFEALFWQSHPYKQPVIGWPSDLRTYSAAQADAFFQTYYAPNNITAALVGNFDPKEVRALAERYFGRLERRPAPPDIVTLEIDPLVERRMRAECDCQPQVEMRYLTVPFRHKDSYAIDVLAALLNGRTGRLYKSLVSGQQIASEARASQASQKWAGSFSLVAESKGEATPGDLEQAIEAEIARLQNEPIPAEELQKVKNQIAADNFRRLQSEFFLLIQLLYADGLGDWTAINDSNAKLLAVTAEDVQRVAKTYLQPERRAVAHYYRKSGSTAEPVPAELEGLPAPVQQRIMAQVKQLRTLDDRAKLQEALAQIEAQKAAVPPGFQKALEYVAAEVSKRLAALGQEGGE